MTGKVKFFNESKGFGFIIEDESQNEVFVHVSGLTEQVNENDHVSYELVEGKKRHECCKRKENRIAQILFKHFCFVEYWHSEECLFSLQNCLSKTIEIKYFKVIFIYLRIKPINTSD